MIIVEEISEDVTEDSDDDTLDDEFRHHKRNYYMTKMDYERVTPYVLYFFITTCVQSEWVYNGRSVIREIITLN